MIMRDWQQIQAQVRKDIKNYRTPALIYLGLKVNINNLE